MKKLYTPKGYWASNEPGRVKGRIWRSGLFPAILFPDRLMPVKTLGLRPKGFNPLKEVCEMKITGIETYSTSQLCFVQVNFDNGIQGIGQTAPFAADISAMVMHRQIAPGAIGKELSTDIADLAKKIAEDPLAAGGPGNVCEEIALTCYKHFGSHLFRTLSGLDTALWDALGKAAGKPVYSLLGGTKKAIAVYGSSMDRVMPEEDEAARMKARYLEGYGAFKLHCAHPNGNNVDTRPGRTERVVKLVRQAVGSAELYVDVNGNYSPEYAISRIPFLKEQGVSILEEPCKYWELAETRQVHDAAKTMGISIAGGEQDYMLSQWRSYCSPQAVDIAQPDICYIGGFSRSLLVARMSQRAGLLCTPHCANRSLLPVFSSHFLCSIKNGFPFLEYSIEDEPWTEDLFTEALSIQNGKLTPLEKAGWGIDLNPAWLKKAAFQATKC
jgi:L-alanine-DL-glutamate epimerase-like enolase superfamily enzyme